MPVELVCVPPDTVHKVWPSVCHLIHEAMRRTKISSYRLLQESVLSGKSLLWLAWDGVKINAAAVTELHQTEFRKDCVIVACGGSGMNAWLPLIDGIEKFARAENCHAVRIVARRGWQRKLREYRAPLVVLQKELT